MSGRHEDAPTADAAAGWSGLPVRQAVVVPADAVRTFDVLVRDIGAWWPVAGYSLGGRRVVDVRLDGRVGGTLVEVWDDGSEHAWGEVLAWDPPRGFTTTWVVTQVPTEVELRVRPLGPGLSRVEVEHRGWQGLDDAGAGRGSYETGWVLVLDRLRQHLDVGR